MKCHYEVLNIPRNAEESEVKAAYRKNALKWHPDKNIDDPENAKEQFQLIQQAYEVLSDQHERAWYDNHREQILRGGQTGYEDNSLDVFQYFTASCYKGFGDGPGGFYSIFAEVFKTIAAEDIEYMENEEEFETIPMFGNSTSNYESDVGPFYAHWSNYCTKKSYAWLCPHNIAEIRDRRILKVIEKEGKKIQQKARKDRNEAVRNLVAFVRKRDKRVKAYKEILEVRAKDQKAKQEKQRVDQMLKRKKELDKQIQQKGKVDEEYEQMLQQLESAYTDSEYEEEDGDDEETSEGKSLDEENEESVENGVDSLNINDESSLGDNDLYCVACNKLFKSICSYDNHESSKKHKENVDKLIENMENDDQHFDQEGDEEAETPESIKIAPENGISSEDEKLPEEVIPKQKNKTKTKKKNKVAKCEVHDSSGTNSENEGGVWSDDNKPAKKNKKSKKWKLETYLPSSSQPANTINAEMTPEAAAPVAKKKGKKAAVETVNELTNVDIDHVCVTCHEKFDSKNKLFNHLKRLNHGVFINKIASAAKAVSVTEKPKKGKKK